MCNDTLYVCAPNDDIMQSHSIYVGSYKTFTFFGGKYVKLYKNLSERDAFDVDVKYIDGCDNTIIVFQEENGDSIFKANISVYSKNMRLPIKYIDGPYGMVCLNLDSVQKPVELEIWATSLSYSFHGTIILEDNAVCRIIPKLTTPYKSIRGYTLIKIE